MARLSAPDFGRFPDHDALTGLVRAWCEERPHLVTAESIGRSWQGRDIWMLTLTNTATGPADDKPAMLIEANVHAAELTSSLAALHFVHHLLAEHGHDEQATRLLDDAAVYVVPRLCPDGAETVLDERRYVRSSARPYPRPSPEPGLHECDVDGDGRVLFMRQPDPYGPWKPSKRDPRLLVRRQPDEHGGEYFRLFVEGEVVGYDGLSVPVAPPTEGLDLAANFHSAWADPIRSPGAGEFTGSEPEIQALLRAVTARRNIGAYIACHTFGAVHLHPPLNADDVVPQADLLAYRDLGELASRHTGYPTMSYQDLKHAPYRVAGGQLGWFYQERGVLAWITELWNPLRAAGVEDFHPARWLVDHPEDDDHALIAWSDAELGGDGFVDWYAFDHPQLGKVELGGWDLINFWYNPPPALIEAEVAAHTGWLVTLGQTLPRLTVRDTIVETVGADVHRVRVAVGNTGWLPTSATQQAAEFAACGEVEVRATGTGGAVVLSGAGPAGIGQLAGRAGARTTTTWWGHDAGTPDVAVHEVLVHAPDGGGVEVTARHERAGVARTRVELPDAGAVRS